MKSYKGLKLLFITVFIMISTSACSMVTDVLGAPTLPATLALPTLLPTDEAIPETIATPEPTATLTAAIQPVPTMTATTEEGTLRQWAGGADAGTEASGEGSTAEQAIGQPDTRLAGGQCAVQANAWAPVGDGTESWLEVTYEIPVFPTEVRVIQTNAPGRVTQVEVIDLDGVYHSIYQSQTEDLSAEDCPYELHVPIKDLDAMVYGVRITVDGTAGDEPVGIDAVELVGITRDSTPSGSVDVVPGKEADETNEALSIRSVEISGIPAAEKAPAGGYYFRVFTEQMDTLFINTENSDRSTDDEIIVDLVNDNGQYTLTLFISPDFGTDFVVLEHYGQATDVQAPSALLQTPDGAYTVAYGSYQIEAVGAGTLSGNFIMAMQSTTDPEQYISVEGAFNGIPVARVQ